MTKRILVLNHFAAAPGSPGGTRHVEMYGRLSGWQATIIAASRNLLSGGIVESEPPLFETVPVVPYRSNGPMRIANWVSYAIFAGWKALRSPRPDVVVGSSPHLLAGLAGLLVSKAKRCLFVLEVRDIWPRVLVEMGTLSEDSRVYRALRKLELLLYRQADRVVVLAEGSAAHVEASGIPPARIVFIPNGADPEDLRPPAPPEELRQRYGLPPDALVFVYTGAHGPANGLDFLLDAAAHLGPEREDIVFLLVGGGVSKADLVERVERERLLNVRFMDPIPKAEMPALLGASDVGLHCLAENPLFSNAVSPNKLFDYMASGLPVITNTPGAVARIVEESGGGVTVPPAGIAAGVETLLGMEPASRARMGRKGREYMTAYGSRAIMVKRLEAMLEDMTQG